MDNAGYRPRDADFATKTIHAAQIPDNYTYAPVVPPLYTTTTFKQEAPGKHQGFYYGRSGNPTRKSLEDLLASLDNTQYGLVFPSGMASVAACAELLKFGDHVLCGNDVYGGTSRYFRSVLSNHGIETTFVDMANPVEVRKSILPNTKMVWLESPTNPLLKIIDIPEISAIVKEVNADILLVVDNTFLTSYYQQPLKLGADIVAYSMTKYYNGHSDVVMGAITTGSSDVYDKMRFYQTAAGSVPSPRDCQEVIRSIKTLPVRMQQHMKNAIEVAKFMENHPLVERVIFPGLESHPQSDLAKKLWSGVCGMMSFYIKGGLEESTGFLKALKVFTLAESLGGYESLAGIPSIMSHASLPPETRERLGITDNLIRLSIGLESSETLIADLAQALNSETST